MNLAPLIPVHIIAGLTALVAGAVALYTAKGLTLHRKSGLVFVAAMLVMAGSAVVMELVLEPDRINVVAGSLTFYLVLTGLFTVRRNTPNIRWIDLGTMLLAIVVGLLAFNYGFMAAGSGGDELDDMPSSGYFVFGIVALLAAFGDLRLLRAGGIQGKNKIARHLWRMCLAFFVAAGSFFLGQADEFPEEIRRTGLLGIPVLIIVLTSLYWVVRVSFTQWYRRLDQVLPGK